MKIVRIGFANFRSIGPSPVILDLRKRVNLLIGANNSGKSNVLEVLQRLKKQKLPEIKLSEVDLHQRNGNTSFQLIIDIEGTGQDEVPDGVGRFHMVIAPGSIHWTATPFEGLDRHTSAPFLHRWLGKRWTGSPSTEQFRAEMEAIAASMLTTFQVIIPELHVIPQFRRIMPGEYKLDGAGIVELLGKWKAPAIGKDADRSRFHKVETFLRELLGMSDIGLDVSRENTELIVERGNLRLPLANYGTGIQQLIILAIAVLAHDDALIGIEEPEIHLHPLLQKAFLRFLVDKTNNRYVITTHTISLLRR